VHPEEAAALGPRHARLFLQRECQRLRGGRRGQLELSIVVPAFNEEQRLPKSLQDIRAYVKSRSLRAEVLVVDDGSTDATAKVVEDSRAGFPELRLISNRHNHGKGFSVRQGMLEACGEIALFTDADLSTPIAEADKLLAVLRDDAYDGAIGSRAVDRSLIEVHQPAVREQAGILFNRIVRSLIGLPFQDTQCGFKAFHREKARVIFERQRRAGFGFDPEILFLAQQEGLRIAEVPVRWAHNPATKVNLLGDSLGMFLDVLAIRWNAWMGRYSTQ
jgi:dolichyl-phosphate beta-glucosyltransferase